MSIHDLIQNAKAVDMFSDLNQKDKKLSILKGKVAAAIINERHSLKMNQTTFAKYLGYSQSMISKWETGEYNFTIEKLYDISEKLGLDLEISFSHKKKTTVSSNSYMSQISHPSTFSKKGTIGANYTYSGCSNGFKPTLSTYTQ